MLGIKINNNILYAMLFFSTCATVILVCCVHSAYTHYVIYFFEIQLIIPKDAFVPLITNCEFSYVCKHKINVRIYYNTVRGQQSQLLDSQLGRPDWLAHNYSIKTSPMVIK